MRFCNRLFSYSAKEPGSSVTFIHFYTRNSIEWRWVFYHYFAHSKTLQNRPFSYSTKEPESSDIFIQFYTRGSIEWS